MRRSRLFMWQSISWGVGIFLPACVFSLAGGSALADVIPISVSQSVSGTEEPEVCVGGFIGTCSSNSSGFSVSNTTVGPYSVNKSDQATATIFDYEDGASYSVTASAQADQSSNETANSISVSMDTTTGIATGATGFLSPVDGGQAQGTNDFTFQFDLSAPSLVDLTGSASTDEGGMGLFPTFSQNMAFSLIGPGFDLDTAIPTFQAPLLPLCSAGVCSGNFGDTFLLAPGVYTLTASDGDGIFAPIGINVTNSEDLSLQLDFTPVPEPRWAAILLLALLMTAGWAVRRLHAPYV